MPDRLRQETGAKNQQTCKAVERGDRESKKMEGGCWSFWDGSGGFFWARDGSGGFFLGPEMGVEGGWEATRESTRQDVECRNQKHHP